jgi:phosphoglycerate dehydrogenase-like enzyme
VKPAPAKDGSMRITIATPVEPELVERIRAVDPRNEVLYEAALLPPPRFPSDHRGAADFARDAAGEARWQAMIAQADVLYGVPGDAASGLADAVRRAPNLRWVQATAAGAGEQVRGANLGDALERVVVTTAAGVHGTVLAEFVYAGALWLLRDLDRLAADRAARAWPHYANRELYGGTLAVVGMGAIGAAVARVGRAFGLTTIGLTRDGAPRDGGETDETLPLTQLESAFARADLAVVTLPGTALTTGLVNAAAIAALPAGAIFANVGRGAVADEAALLAALRANAIRGAVLDVFAQEPLPPEHPFWTMDNVILSPHTAALSARENERIVDLFCDNLRRYAQGRPLRNVVDTREFY